MAWVHRARGYLGQERAVDLVVGRAHQHEFGVVRPQPLLQLVSAGEPREARADDQDTPPTSAVHGQTVVLHNVVSSSTVIVRIVEVFGLDRKLHGRTPGSPAVQCKPPSPFPSPRDFRRRQKRFGWPPASRRTAETRWKSQL